MPRRTAEDTTAVRPFSDLTGRQFGFLRVIAHAGTDRHRRRKWRVHCQQCGWSVTVLASNLLSGRSKSCGCTRWAKAKLRMKFLTLVEKCSKLQEQGLTEEQAIAEFKRQLNGYYE